MPDQATNQGQQGLGGVPFHRHNGVDSPLIDSSYLTGIVKSINGIATDLNIVGITNQIGVATAGTTITLSTPQDIGTSSSPTFSGMYLTNLQTTNIITTNNLTISNLTGILQATNGIVGVAVISQFGAPHYVASDVLQHSDNAEKNTNLTTYVKKKEIKISMTAPTTSVSQMRVSIDIRRQDTGGQCNAEIYKNGVFIGVEMIETGSTYVTYTQDLGSWSNNDLLQVWIKSNNNSYSAYVRNLRLSFDFRITTVDVYALVSPILVSPTDITFNDQDP
jgi:hypothetical protein